ncbi:unnamed protein product [Nippostrongylus brasiliensis]|uniref:G_PROTEIN_RECEP_F1_2 domain-containing protein n=1 Tax=Nippostrongylus brasiliensis TaxID=27835 RepID=A0A0N4XLG8_NIPBR|nr:unnamed protein product [Nippostrongylus brasiliensis]
MVDLADVCGEFCTEKWPNVHSKRIYTLFVLAIQFIIPFTIMTICYQAVFAFLRRRAKSRLTSIAQQANLLYVVAATAGGDTQQHKEQLSVIIITLNMRPWRRLRESGITGCPATEKATADEVCCISADTSVRAKATSDTTTATSHSDFGVDGGDLRHHLVAAQHRQHSHGVH